MNKYYYSFGNPFKVKFRQHYCYECGSKLFIVKHRKIVNQNSDEAKYYDFSFGATEVMIGSCEFIHNVFYCPMCKQTIEFVSQINKEDISIFIKNIEKYFNNKGKTISIKKYFENMNNELVEKDSIENIKDLCLLIEDSNMNTYIYRVPMTRKKVWERPYYFDVKKKDIIKFIKENI